MQTGKQIWILEDDQGSQFVYKEILDEIYLLNFFSGVQEFNAALNLNEVLPDLLIADIRLADDSFLNFIGRRKVPLPFKFIVVSSVDDVDALHHCFRFGAIDYITKPFGRNEILVKVEKICGKREINLNPNTFTVHRGNIQSHSLTVKEFQILSALMDAADNTLNRKNIMMKIWRNTNVTLKTLDVHLFNLRKKIAPLGLDIRYSPPNEYKLSDRVNH